MQDKDTENIRHRLVFLLTHAGVIQQTCMIVPDNLIIFGIV